jgi:hypothetical protein
MLSTKSSPFEHNCCIDHVLLFRQLIEQSGIIATKFSVCAMAIIYTPLQCNIYTSLMDASFMCHVTMEDTHHLVHFSLQHRCDIFWTSFGTALYFLSTVTHARVPLADQDFLLLSWHRCCGTPLCCMNHQMFLQA